MQNIENGASVSNSELSITASGLSDDENRSASAVDPDPIMPLDAYGCYYRENVTKFIDEYQGRRLFCMNNW